MLRRALTSILMLVMLTGCWSRIELNDLGVALGMAVDQGESAPVRLTFYIARSMGGGAGGGPGKSTGDPSWVVSREAQNIADAMREIALASPRRISLHHLRVVLVGEDYARSGVGELMDVVARHPQIRLTTRPIVVEGRAEAVLRAPPRLESLQPQSLAELIQAKGGVEQRFKDFLVGRISKARSSWMHVAQVLNLPEEGGPTVQLAGMGVFLDDRLVTLVAPREAQALFWLLQNPRESVISAQCPGGDPDKTFSVEVDEGRTYPIPQMTGNQVSVLVRAEARVNLVRSDCPQSLVDPDRRQLLQSALQGDLTDRLDAAVRKLQGVKADPVGIGRHVQRAFPAQWRRIADDWPEVWARTTVRYDVLVTIHHSGLLIDPVNRTRGTVPGETP